jgi:2Fe-2S ferredoxin
MAYSPLRVEPPQARKTALRRGECGGSRACAACHCCVDEGRLAKLQPPDDNELAMLDLTAAEVRPNSRLSCQLKASPAIDGLVVRLTETQG